MFSWVGLGSVFFAFVFTPTASAIHTPLSGCPSLLKARAFAAEIDAHPEWTDDRIIHRFYVLQSKEIQNMILDLEERLAVLQEKVRKPYISAEQRKEFAVEFRSVRKVLRACQEYEIPIPYMEKDLATFRTGTVGEILARSMRHTADSLLDDLGIEMATPEQERIMMSAILLRNRPEEVVKYVPSSRERVPSKEVFKKLEVLLEALGGRVPAPELLKRIWNRPLVRSDLYGYEWGRMEIYWELVQHNPQMDLHQPMHAKRIVRIVDKIEELLLRPRPLP